MARSLGRTGRRWRRARATLFQEAPDVCWLCGHAGTTDADHDPPLVVLEQLGLDPCDPQWLKRAHGVDGCPTCNRRCNQERGTKPSMTRLDTSRRW